MGHRRWTLGLALGVGLTALTLLLGRLLLPFEIRTPDTLLAGTPVNPSAPLLFEVQGLGARFSRVELMDDQGRTLARAADLRRVELKDHLGFGQHYRVQLEAERPWLRQTALKQVDIVTPRLPRIESSLSPQLDAEGRFEVRFSEPVGRLRAEGELAVTVTPTEDPRRFQLTARNADELQDRHLPLILHWSTPEGIPLPSFEVEVGTAPPLTVSLETEGMKNLGLAMPVDLTFSEAVQHRDKATEGIQIVDAAGRRLSGKWLWYGKQKAQFRPDPLWPPNQTLEVRMAQGSARSVLGGTLARPWTGHFATGNDRRIEVYLDRQRVEVFENGELIKTLRASTGKSKTPTVTGSFYIYARYPKKTMKSTGLRPGEKGYYEVKDVPFAQYFYEGYAFHGAFWHNAFGQPASHGCINLATQQKNSRKGVNEDAGWLYQWASLGVPVTVHGRSEETPAASSPAVTTP